MSLLIPLVHVAIFYAAATVLLACVVLLAWPFGVRWPQNAATLIGWGAVGLALMLIL